jgi:general secretion pathway protein K
MMAKGQPTGRQRGQRGVALVLVLWVIMVLSLLISGFAFTMHVETQITSFSRKQLKAEALARAGLEVAIMQLTLDLSDPKEAGFDARGQAWATNESLYVDHLLGEGSYNVSVVDEESKLPINRLTPEQLKRVVELLDFDPAEGDVIVDSILDWIDENDLHRLNGAEDEYYATLIPPYRAKNGPLDRVEELLLVQGVTKEVFYGTPATEEAEAVPGFVDLFTTTSVGLVNVNTASELVLQVAFELDETQAESITMRRNGSDGVLGTEDDMPFATVDEFFATAGISGGEQRQQLQRQATVNSTFFTITSVGRVANVKHTISTIVRREGGAVLPLTWNEKRGGT